MVRLIKDFNKLQNNQKEGFTLIEVLVTMIIMMIIGVAMIQVITRPKPRIEKVTIRGQYACWAEGEQLYEQYMDERTAREEKKAVSQCELQFDQRPGRYYIIASGAGQEGAQGQVVTKYSTSLSDGLEGFSSTLSDRLMIQLGTMGNNGYTVVMSPYNSQTPEIKAGPGMNTANHLIPDNIKSCKLKSAGADCPNITSEPKKQKSCEIVDLVENDPNASSTTSSTVQSVVAVRIYGCDDFKDDGTITKDNVIPISSLVGTESISSEPSDQAYTYNNVSMNFEYFDSSYITNNTNDSRMSKIIDGISAKRKSELTKYISNLRPGAPGNPGAVLVLW